jgi:hypothetical protein
MRFPATDAVEFLMNGEAEKILSATSGFAKAFDVRERRSTSRLVVTLGMACIVACVAFGGCARGSRGSWASQGEAALTESGNSYPSPISSEAAAKLIALAPKLGKNSFGAGVDVTVFRPSWLLGEARVVDETLYVTYNTEQSPYQEIASLVRGVLHPILLPRGYYALSFRNGNRLISAVLPSGARDWYELRAGGAILTNAPSLPAYGVPPHVLADGDSCADGLVGSGSALDELRAHHRVSILTSVAMSRPTGGTLARAIEVYCDHFHGANYATLDSLGIIMQLDGDGATLVGNGWIQAASERHLLITERDGLMVEVIATKLPDVSRVHNR